MEPFESWFGKIAINFILLVIFGGVISLFYSYLQKRRELRMELIKEFVDIHAAFYSVRKKLHNVNEAKYQQIDIDKKKAFNHDLFQQCCDLEGKFRALQTLIKSHFGNTELEEYLKKLEEDYEEWRHSVQDNSRRIKQCFDQEADQLYAKIIHILERRAFKIW